MKLNYYFLWNYNKFPFIYSILKKEEKNILVINSENNRSLNLKLKNLEKLEKITKVILIKNDIKNNIIGILYRIFIFPLKKFSKKKEEVTFFISEPGRINILWANLNIPNNIIYYEEGESLYVKNYIFKEKITSVHIKNSINNFLKKVLFCPKSYLKDIKKIYVRDKYRFVKLLQSVKYTPNFEIIEIKEDEELKKLSNFDKELLKKIFLSEINIEKNLKKKVVILTQPLYLDNPISEKETVYIFNDCIKKFREKEYEIYLKLHPKESQDKYLKEDVKRIKGEFPFELLSLLNITFDVGITYNSTAINTSFINKKNFINK